MAYQKIRANAYSVPRLPREEATECMCKGTPDSLCGDVRVVMHPNIADVCRTASTGR